MMSTYRYFDYTRTSEEEAAIEGYVNILFVDSNGSNTDGSSWQSAYTSISAAMTAAAALTGLTAIYIGLGTYDMNVTGAPTYTNDMALLGSGKHLTVIKNDHASATAVMKLQGQCIIKHLTLDGGTGEDCLIVDGTSANGSHFEDIYFEGDSHAAAADCVQLSGGVKYLEFHDCRMHGDSTNTTCIITNNSLDNFFMNCHIHSGLIGASLSNGADHGNVFDHCVFRANATGVSIASGADNNAFINQCTFLSNTADVSDQGTGTYWSKDTMVDEVIQILPATNAAVQVAGHASAGTWTASYTQIDDGTGFTANKPFKIISVSMHDFSDTNAMYGIDIGTGAGAAEVTYAQFATHGTSSRADANVQFDGEWIAPQTRISARVQSESGGGDTVKLILEFVEMK